MTRAWRNFKLIPASLVLRLRLRNRQRKVAKAPGLLESAEPSSRVVGGFINLASRPDRRLEVTRELARVGLASIVCRFEGIKDSNGALGCAKSHISLLEHLARESKDAVAYFVCEDDLEFVAAREKIWIAIEEFLWHSPLDVFCIANHTLGSQVSFSENLNVANGIQTTAGYLVKIDSVERLLAAFRKSENLLKQGIDPELAAIDMVWKRLQKRQLLFCVPKTRLARQRASFSDIEKRVTDYGV